MISFLKLLRRALKEAICGNGVRSRLKSLGEAALAVGIIWLFRPQQFSDEAFMWIALAGGVGVVVILRFSSALMSEAGYTRQQRAIAAVLMALSGGTAGLAVLLRRPVTPPLPRTEATRYVCKTQLEDGSALIELGITGESQSHGFFVALDFSQGFTHAPWRDQWFGRPLATHKDPANPNWPEGSEPLYEDSGNASYSVAWGWAISRHRSFYLLFHPRRGEKVWPTQIFFSDDWLAYKDHSIEERASTYAPCPRR